MVRYFIDKIYPKILDNVLVIFDIRSDIIVGLWSVILLLGCAYSIYKTNQVSAPVATIFSVVITNFSAHKISQVLKGQQDPEVKEAAKKEIDCDTKGDENGTGTQG